MRKLSLILFLIFGSTPAWGGYVELGLSGNYRYTHLSDTAYDRMQSVTGSMAYYFAEQSALELSYTQGSSLRLVPGTEQGDIRTTMDYSMVGLDFVLTAGGREAMLAPYIKVGAAYILEKVYVIEYGTFGSNSQKDEPALVPSAGVGFRFALTKFLALKAGLDAWTSRSLNERPIRIDYAGRAGVSWMF